MKKLSALFLSIFLLICSAITALAIDDSVFDDNGINEDYEVFVTSGGKKYHSSKCYYIKDNNEALPIRIYDAVLNDYTPCLVCKPFKLNSDYKSQIYADYEKLQESSDEEKNNSSISNIVFLIIIEIFVFGFFIMSWLKVVRTSAYYQEESLMKTLLDRITNNGTLYFLRYTDGFTNVIYDYSKIYLVFLVFSLMIYFNYSTFFWILTTIMSTITIIQWLHHRERCSKIISFVQNISLSHEARETVELSIDMGGRIFAPVIGIYKRKRDMSIICLVLLYVTGLIAK